MAAVASAPVPIATDFVPVALENVPIDKAFSWVACAPPPKAIESLPQASV
ncbi:hypothetical protein WFW50_01425 [Acinetobacter junii]